MSKKPLRITKEMHETLITVNKVNTISLDDLTETLKKPRALSRKR